MPRPHAPVRRLHHPLRACATLLLVAASASACGGASEPAAAPEGAAPADPAAPSASAAATPAEEKAGPAEVPTACGTEDPCLPPVRFVKKLCQGFYPDVALTMFKKGTPWQRGYLTRTTDAWNASGGVSSNDKVVFDEEVLVLFQRQNDTGIQVSGASGNVDVLRWDGTCASLAGEEITRKPPPKAKNAKIPWKSLDKETKDALLDDEKVKKAQALRGKECKGATMGEVSLACVKADDGLSDAIVAYVRDGGALPKPKPVP